jgi:D-sedoheptulose 7-phosphate isomerase
LKYQFAKAYLHLKHMTEDIIHTISQAFKTGRQVLHQFLENQNNLLTVQDMAQDFAQCFSSGKKVLTCGNGGSACEAIHFAEELTARYRKHRRALPVISLCEPAYLTCVGNDYGFNHIFARGVEAYGRPGDILLALSTSGNSQNVIDAVETAKSQDMKTFLLTGKTGGKMKGTVTRELLVEAETTDRIQEIHMICIHILIESIERILFPENYQ